MTNNIDPEQQLLALQQDTNWQHTKETLRKIAELSDPYQYTEGLSLGVKYRDRLHNRSNRINNSFIVKGLNNLAMEFVNVLLPNPMFSINKPTHNKLRQLFNVDENTNIEQYIGDLVYQNNKTFLYQLIKQLILCGNVLEYNTGVSKIVIPITDYGLLRDKGGNIIKIAFRYLVHNKDIKDASNTQSLRDIMTYYCVLEDNKWRCHYKNSVNGSIKTTTYKIDEAPFNALSWSKPNNEDYTSGLLEYHEPLLANYQTILTKEIELTNKLGQKVHYLRSALSGFWLNKLKNKAWLIPASSGNSAGRIVEGVTRIDNTDITQLLSLRQNIESSLADIFLLVNGSIRNAERVTGTEVSAVQAQLQDKYQEQYILLLETWQIKAIKSILTKEILGDELYNEFYFSILTSIDLVRKQNSINKLLELQQIMMSLIESNAKASQVGYSFDVITVFDNIKEKLGIDIDIKLAKIETQGQQEQEDIKLQQ